MHPLLTATSSFPSPSRSAKAMVSAFSPPEGYSCSAWKLPSPFPSRTAITPSGQVPLQVSATTRSGLPSLLTSPTATETGYKFEPPVKCGLAVWKVPSPFPSRTAITPPDLAVADTCKGTCPEGVFAVAVGDFNRDGKLDLALANE